MEPSIPPIPRAALQATAWSGIDGLRGQLGAFAEVHRASRTDPLCCSPEWTLAYAEAYAAPATVFGWTFRTPDGEPVGILPMRMEPGRKAWELRRAIFAGDGSFDSDYLDIPVRRGYELSVAEACLDVASARSGVEALVFSCMPESSAMLRAFRLLLEYRRLPAREIPVACLAAPLLGSFDSYISSLKPRMRSKVRSAIRTAEQKGAQLVWCDRADELDFHLSGLYKLHGDRWNDVGQSGSFADTRRRDFYHRISRVLLERGKLRFARLEIGGKIVAYQFGAVAGTSYYQIQEGFDPEWKEARVGVALRGIVVKELQKEGIQLYDFMAGAQRHKEEWGGKLRSCTTLAFALPKLRARIAYGVRQWLDRRRQYSPPPPPAAADAPPPEDGDGS